MNLLYPGGFGALIAAVAWYAAGGSSAPAYPISIDVAEARLRSMTFEESILTGQPFTVEETITGDALRLGWAFGRPSPTGRPSSCTVDLSPLGEARVSADLKCALHRPPPDPATAKPARKLLELVMTEHVEAALEDRPFDHDSMGRKLIAFSVANRPALVSMQPPDSD